MSGLKNPFLNPVDRLKEINEQNLKIWEKIIGILCPPVADGTIPKGLNPPPPATPPVPPNPGDKPTIAPPPRVIYVPTGNGYRPDVDITIKTPPSIPPRRLPKEADGQSPTPTPKKRSISIKTALYDEIHGELLTFPITQKPVKFKEYELDGFAEKMKLILETSANYFGNWMAVQQGETLPKEYPKPTIFDGTALITPNYLAGLSGNIGLMYGTKALAMLASAYQVSRKNAYQPVSGYVPLEIQISIEEIPDPDPFFLTDPEIENSGLGKIRTATGASGFPVTVPSSLVNHTPEDLEVLRKQQIKLLELELQSVSDAKLKKAINEKLKTLKAGPIPAYQDIKSIPELLTWLATALSQVHGAFPFEIMIEDGDIMTVEEPPDHPIDQETLPLVRYEEVNGKKRKYIRVPSAADAISDIYLTTIENQHVNAMQMRYLASVLLELTQTRQQLIRTHSLADSIRDWLGISTIDKMAKVPFTCNPMVAKNDKGNRGLKQFLQPAQIEVPIEEIDTATEKETLSSILAHLAQGAAIVKESMTVPLEDPDKVPAGRSKWMQKIKEMAGQGAAHEKDMDRTLEEIEMGYIGSANVSDLEKPYGKPLKNRPKLKRATYNPD